MVITDQLINEVWNKGRIIDGYPESQIRQDACGAWIRRDDYGKIESPFGWDIDHIFPQKKLTTFDVPQIEIDDIRNLRPMHWKNNVSKGTDYPSYRAVVKSDGSKNVESETFFTVNRDIQAILSQLFDKYLK